MKEKFDIKRLGSMCGDGLKFYKQFDIFESAWTACERGDWMLYIAALLEVDKRVLTLSKGHCANTVRHLMLDERSIKAVDIAIAYGEGRATENELNAAFIAAYYAAYAADNCDDAAYAAANAADTSAYAAADAASAAADAYSNGPKSYRKDNEKLTADICHKYLTESVLIKIKEYEK
jgi:hypothetical protein